MKTRLIIPALCAALLLTGCTGSIYSNYRETEELSVIQAMGFDTAPAGVRVSVAADEKTKLAAEAENISSAQDKLQDLSPSEDIFFAHTSYAVLGEGAARQGIAHIFDFVERSTEFRLGMPVFVLTGDDASTLVLGAEDAAKIMRSLERNLDKRGSCHVASAGEIAADLDRNGASLICAVKPVESKSADPDAEDGEISVVPAGYAVIRNGRMVGTLDMDTALGVELLLNRAGPCEVALGDTAVQLDKAECEITPAVENGRVDGLDITLTVSATLAEKGDAEDTAVLLSHELKTRLSRALNREIELDCDFMQLAARMEAAHPFRYRELALDPAALTYNIKVVADIDRSFDLKKTEGEP